MTLSELQTTGIKTLTGVGPKACEAYKALGVESLSDLIGLRPRGYEDRTHRICIGNQKDSMLKTNTIVQVLSKSRFGKGLNSVKAIVQDTENGVKGELLGFNRSFLDRVLFEGSYYHLYASQMPYNGFGRIQFSQFEVKPVREEELIISDMVLNGGLLPVYPLAGSLTQNTIRRDIKNVLSRTEEIENDLPEHLYEKYHLISRDSAIRKMHFPSCPNDITQALRTMGFTEVFYMQLLALRRVGGAMRRAVENKVYPIETQFVQSLPFSLTADQITVLEEIRKDMASDQSMNRLLQGDVGAGKTLVAWISALHAIAENRQVAFMAPTELLARQHAQSAAKLFENLPVNVAYLDGQVHGKSRTLLLKALKKGEIDIIIGTHALFSKDVEYANLGYVIIDEQHRFGVEQRRALSEKGRSPDILLMTATPIPRTLALTIYGNLNVSTIKTMPAGRLPIKTFVVGDSKREEMYSVVGTELQRGHQAYFVYPRIEEDENSDLRSVEQMYGQLCERYKGFKGEMIHSRLEDDEKIRILNEFAKGNVNFLVATSVVEVGIDVAKATCMVIEHADTFGLSALHQLRGRVGRSTLQSWCFLVYDSGISEDGKKRLSVLRRTNDGFVIAEEDLKIRGPGEISGLRQSGFTNLRYAALDDEKDINMMKCAREEVKAILASDPGLIKLENAVVRKCIQCG